LLLLSFQNCGKNKFAFSNAPVVVSSISTFRPALAVSETKCMMCHASIQGNLITDLNFQNGHGDFYGSNPAGVGTGDYIFSTYRSDSMSRSTMASTMITGTLYVPSLMLNPTTMDHMSGGFDWGVRNAMTIDSATTVHDMAASVGRSSSSQNMLYDNPPMPQNSDPWSAAQFYNLAINYRSNDYLSVMWPGRTPPQTQIREISSVTITAPTETEIRNLLPAGKHLSYRPSTGTDIKTLSGFSEYGGFYGNVAGLTMKCDGDLIVDGPIYFKNLNLETHEGCRIYTTGTVIIEGPQGTTLHRTGITYSADVNANLQITSSRAILFGLGKCTNPAASGANASDGMFPVRIGRESETPGLPSLSGPVLADYHLMVDANGKELPSDAGDCANSHDPRRSVDFSRILANAPRVDTRYTGNFKGVIISKFSLMSLGDFSYIYDETFDGVSKILPLIPETSFFTAEDCIVNGVDHSNQIDTRYRSCN